jgi:hypothetical protein
LHNPKPNFSNSHLRNDRQMLSTNFLLLDQIFMIKS